MTIPLGCIADDLTGATDLASVLAREGMSTTLMVGVPASAPSRRDPGAIVVALKSRTIPAADAVSQSRAALARLQEAGARQIFFKYCSTFDSTDDGNIGPVADALLEATGETTTVICPAYPRNRRTVYQGHLFVGDMLLSDSPMRHHPLTPMTDANLQRVLARQSARKVGLVPCETIGAGPVAIRTALDRLRASGVAHAVVDATEDRHLVDIGESCRDFRLLTGGAGLAIGLPRIYRRQGLLGERQDQVPLDWPSGPAAILAGSSSAATLAQVRLAADRWPSFRLDPMRLAADGRHLDAAIAWAGENSGATPILIHAGAPADELARVHAALGRDRAGALIERAFGRIAERLVAGGVRRIVVAGGETAGAVVERLGIDALEIGPEIAPGVPWTLSVQAPRMALALKSGNFGGPNFFAEALESIP